MGNSNRKHSVGNIRNSNSTDVNRHRVLEQNISDLSFNLSGRSFASVNSQHSTYSVSRPWSRVSRRRWKESTLTLPFEASKTAWPVSNIESLFLPEFPVSPLISQNFINIVEFIAYGAFGKVYKVKEKTSDKLYALKVLSKSKIIKENSIEQVKDEVQIQRVCGHHPFIVNCPFHWQTRKRLYIVSEFVEGGELHHLCETYGILPVTVVQIYIAEIALALDFLHNAGIIYRDLKPENILLDIGGHVQLVDFGLSKWLSYGGRTSTVCGTLRYMAPEVISLQPYGHAVDWWALGVIACQMLTSKFPTAAVSGDADDKKRPGALPDQCELNLPCKDLLLRLLEPDPTKRLRSLRVLQTLAFFMKFDFEEVKKKKFEPAEMLKQHFPDGPPHYAQDITEVIENFDIDLSNNK